MKPPCTTKILYRRNFFPYFLNNSRMASSRTSLMGRSRSIASFLNSFRRSFLTCVENTFFLMAPWITERIKDVKIFLYHYICFLYILYLFISLFLSTFQGVGGRLATPQGDGLKAKGWGSWKCPAAGTGALHVMRGTPTPLGARYPSGGF